MPLGTTLLVHFKQPAFHPNTLHPVRADSALEFSIVIFAHGQQRVNTDGRCRCNHRLRRNDFPFFRHERVLLVQNRRLRQILSGIIELLLRLACIRPRHPATCKTPVMLRILHGRAHFFSRLARGADLPLRLCSEKNQDHFLSKRVWNRFRSGLAFQSTPAQRATAKSARTGSTSMSFRIPNIPERNQ